MRAIFILLLLPLVARADVAVRARDGRVRECLLAVRLALTADYPRAGEHDFCAVEESGALVCNGACLGYGDLGCDSWSSSLSVELELEPGPATPWSQLRDDEHWWRHLAGVHARVEGGLLDDRLAARVRRQAATARQAIDRCLKDTLRDR